MVGEFHSKVALGRTSNTAVITLISWLERDSVPSSCVYCKRKPALVNSIISDYFLQGHLCVKAHGPALVFPHSAALQIRFVLTILGLFHRLCPGLFQLPVKLGQSDGRSDSSLAFTSSFSSLSRWFSCPLIFSVIPSISFFAAHAQVIIGDLEIIAFPARLAGSWRRGRNQLPAVNLHLFRLRFGRRRGGEESSAPKTAARALATRSRTAWMDRWR